MKIAMISTGDEVLQGDIVDTNASWLSARLNEAGLRMSWRMTVADDRQALIDAFAYASERADAVIVNGGLGPTSDDLSAEAAAAALNEPLVEYSPWIAVIEEWHRSRGRPMPEANRKQALLPQSAQFIDNPVGTACGFSIQLNQAQLFFTPGVPSEFKQMIDGEILPQLQAKAGAVQPDLLRWKTFGLSESHIAELLEELPLAEGAVLGYRSAIDGIEVKLKLESQAALAQQSTLTELISSRLGDFVYARAAQSMAASLQQLMLENNATLAVAESCTGGLLASELVAISGSSAYFTGGVVSYSNVLKSALLAVPAAQIVEHGAVSTEVAVAMAKGAQAQTGAGFALATSGIAGPDGGSDEKPVGTVAFALATPVETYYQLLQLPNRGRNFVRQVAALIAIDMLRRHLSGYEVCAPYLYTKQLSVGVKTR